MSATSQLNDAVPADAMREQHRSAARSYWDAVSTHWIRPGLFRNGYQSVLKTYYHFLVPDGLRVLELGCGHGDLLASLKPSVGVGVDLSPAMIVEAAGKYPHLRFVNGDVHEVTLDEVFDVIILSDLINDLWDLQCVLEKIGPLCHTGTRVILNFHNHLWRFPLACARRLTLGMATPVQNWFAPGDVLNLLALSGFDPIRHLSTVLVPIQAPFVAAFANRWLSKFWPFSMFNLCHFVIARPLAADEVKRGPHSVSIVIAARNEAGNVERMFKDLPDLGAHTELVFVEGHSKDKTYEVIQDAIRRYPSRTCSLHRQTGVGKGDAIRLGMEKASGDILMIYDADMTVPPEDLYRFYDAIASAKGEFINGVRLVYPMEEKSMQLLNMIGNKFFSLMFTWLLDQPVKDTLCGTKVLWKRDYELIAANRAYFGDFDPFGDFDLLFGAARQNLKIIEIPIRYRSRSYGTTNISRWKHGWLLLRMTAIAARRLKFI